MMARRRCAFPLLVGWIFLSAWGPSAAQSNPPASPWSVEFVGSQVPNFEEKKKENKKLLLVDVRFRNNDATDQAVEIRQEAFQARNHKNQPIQVVGLLFGVMRLEGAKNLAYTGGIKRMETLTVGQGDSAATWVHTAGPVQVTVAPGRAYTQRLLLARPKGKKPIKLKFGDLPELEVPLPK